MHVSTVCNTYRSSLLHLLNRPVDYRRKIRRSTHVDGRRNSRVTIQDVVATMTVSILAEREHGAVLGGEIAKSVDRYEVVVVEGCQRATYDGDNLLMKERNTMYKLI